MKKRYRLIKLLLSSILSLSLITTANLTEAATYTVRNGDTLWFIGKQYGVSTLDLMTVNNNQSSLIYPGQILTIPQSISAFEKDLLSRLVNAEAKGEPYAGKVAVATVVLNRVASSDFPNTIYDVIHERSAGGYYAFTPVQNGEIKKPADQDAIQAVEEALAFRGQGNKSLYFYNPMTAKSEWILSREVTLSIGNHVFAK